MKKTLIVAIGCLLVFSSFSQPVGKLSFEVSPSINWMRSGDSGIDNRNAIPGYDFGLNADIFMDGNEQYSFSTGLLVTNNGGAIEYRGNNSFSFSGHTLPSRVKITYHLRYLEVPAVVKLKTSWFDRTCYWGQFGLSGGVNIGARGESNDGSFRKENINDEVRLFNVSLNVGMGFDYNLGGYNALTLGLIFNNGLIDVTSNNAFNDKTILNSLKFKVGLIF